MWLKTGAFHAEAPSEKESFCIVMPPPNITGELHMGHALDNTLPDVLTRFQKNEGQKCSVFARHRPCLYRYRGSRRASACARKVSKDAAGRDGFLERAWRWKDEYNNRIVAQQQRFQPVLRLGAPSLYDG